MKPRRFDQLWNRWLLVESDFTFDEWICEIRKRRQQMKHQSTPAVGVTLADQQQQMQHLARRLEQWQNMPYGSLGGLFGAGIQSIGQIGMSVFRPAQR